MNSGIVLALELVGGWKWTDRKFGYKSAPDHTHNATMLSRVREDLSSALRFASTCLASRFERESWPRFRAAPVVVWRNDREKMSNEQS
jgi:hypothetical protein